VHYDKVFIRHNRSGFVIQCRRNAFDEIEEAVPARRDIGAVLNISGRSETFSGRIVALVEQRVERFEDSRLVLLGRGLHHVISFPAVFVLPSAAEPTIFQLSCTTADSRNVSADSFLA
jgi:hypothetical protein